MRSSAPKKRTGTLPATYVAIGYEVHDKYADCGHAMENLQTNGFIPGNTPVAVAGAWRGQSKQCV
jgi:hypothetical protein